MKKFACLSVVSVFLAVVFISTASGCKKQEESVDQEAAGDVVQLEVGEKPYDKEAEALALKFKVKGDIAMAQLQRGVAFAKANGIETLIEILKNPADPRRGNFVAGDYYIWILKSDFKTNAMVVVHPINKSINGRDFFAIKDANGKMFIKDILRICNYKSKGWVAYKWAHPVTKKAEGKLTYSEKFNDYVLSDGFYLRD